MNESFLHRMIFDKRYQLLRHLLFWLLILVFYPLADLTNHSDLKDSYMTAFLLMPGSIIYTYVILYWLVPVYLIKEKYSSFFLLYILWVFVGMCMVFGLRYALLIPYREGQQPFSLDIATIYDRVFRMFPFIVCNSIAMFAVFIKMFKYWYIKQRQTLILSKEKLTAELQLLKSQVHPHFLFNTLNNLYALVLEKSDRAPAMLLKLSGLLSYMLYDCNANRVLLEKELAVMQDYISLEQERYGDRLEISLNISGDIPGKKIAPLLILPFLENAFKHGASEQLKKAWISFDLSVKDCSMQLKLVNSKNTRSVTTDRMCIGVNNVRKRLDLLYPEKYDLQMGDEESVFFVALTLELEREQATLITNEYKLAAGAL